MMQFLIALDQLANTLIGGMADETLSARAHRMRSKGQRILGVDCSGNRCNLLLGRWTLQAGLDLRVRATTASRRIHRSEGECP